MRNENSGEKSGDKPEENTEWWWVEYLEDEMDPALDKDLELLLEHSHEDRLSFESIRVLREWLKACDAAQPVMEEWDQQRQDKLREKVMQEVHLIPDDTKFLRA